MDTASLIARPQWSASGAKAIFCYTTVGKIPGGRVNTFSWTVDGGDSNVYGQTIHFMEFRGDTFYHLYDEQLIITPTQIGPKHYSQVCDGSCRLLAAYDGETPVYATVSFKGESTQNLDESAPAYDKKIQGVSISLKAAS